MTTDIHMGGRVTTTAGGVIFTPDLEKLLSYVPPGHRDTVRRVCLPQLQRSGSKLSVANSPQLGPILASPVIATGSATEVAAWQALFMTVRACAGLAFKAHAACSLAPARAA